MSGRAILGLACAAGTALVGALFLGEYEFTGALPFTAGPLFGLIVGEVAVSVGRQRTGLVAAVAATLAAAGVAWAGWLDSSEGLAPVKPLVWVAAALAGLTAAARTVGLRPGRRAAR